MARNTLIHSMVEFAMITIPVLEMVQAKKVCELGSDHAGNSRLLYNWLVQRQGALITVDEAATEEFKQWAATVNNAVIYSERKDLDVIQRIKTADAWFLYGNPNWFSIHHALCAIYNAARMERQPVLIFIHNVGWPCARRDWYHAPQNIPDSFRQPHAWHQELNLDAAKVMYGRGEKKYAAAMQEGGQHNGVLTAIEDFVAQHPDEFYWGFIPGAFGMGVLFDRMHPQANEISRIIAPFHEHSLLASLEKNRFDNYIQAFDMDNVAAVVEDEEEKDSPELEASVMRLIDMLSDEKDHQDVWDIFNISAASDGKDSLIELANYMDKLMDIQQPAKIVKLLTVAHAVCAAYLGNALFAEKRLEEMAQREANCLLIRGALRRVKAMNKQKVF